MFDPDPLSFIRDLFNSDLLNPPKIFPGTCSFRFRGTKIFLSLTSSIFVAEVGKSPDIAEANRHRDAGEQEVQLVAPLASLVLIPLLVDDVDVRKLLSLPDLELDEVIVLLIIGQGLCVLKGHILASKIKCLNVNLFLFRRR